MLVFDVKYTFSHNCFKPFWTNTEKYGSFISLPKIKKNRTPIKIK